MSGMKETAVAFFEACEAGKGWKGCAQYCHSDSSFSAQAPALADVTTVEEYTNWMEGIFGPVSDAHYELKAMAVDDERQCVVFHGVFKGTHTGDGGPVAATGKKTESDYVYNIEFRDGKISHLTKIWNDNWAMSELGWA